MVVNDKIRDLCKEVIVSYVHKVKDEVRKGNIDYLELGIDTSIQKYKSVFLEVLKEELCVEEGYNVPNGIKEDLKKVIRVEVNKFKYRTLRGYKSVICVTCEYIFEKVVKELESMEGVEIDAIR